MANSVGLTKAQEVVLTDASELPVSNVGLGEVSYEEFSKVLDGLVSNYPHISKDEYANLEDLLVRVESFDTREDILKLMMIKAPFSTIKKYFEQGVSREDAHPLVLALMMNPSIEVLEYLLEGRTRLPVIPLEIEQLLSGAERSSAGLKWVIDTFFDVISLTSDYRGFLVEEFSDEQVAFIFDHFCPSHIGKVDCDGDEKLKSAPASLEKLFHLYPNISEGDFREWDEVLAGRKTFYLDEIMLFMAIKSPLFIVQRYVAIMGKAKEQGDPRRMSAESMWEGVLSTFLSSAILMNPSKDILAYLLGEGAKLDRCFKDNFRELEQEKGSLVKAALATVIQDEAGLCRYVPRSYSDESAELILGLLRI